MNKKTWLEIIRMRDYCLCAGPEVTAANLLLAEVCRHPSDKRISYMEIFISDKNGDVQVDIAALTGELYRLAEETASELADMERNAGTELKKQQMSSARVQLLKVDFALLKFHKSPEFMRFLTDLYYHFKKTKK